MIAASPRNPRHIVCKRVLGLEGDTVCVPVTSRDDARTVKVRSRIDIRSTHLQTGRGCQRTPHAVPSHASAYDPALTVAELHHVDHDPECVVN